MLPEPTLPPSPLPPLPVMLLEPTAPPEPTAPLEPVTPMSQAPPEPPPPSRSPPWRDPLIDRTPRERGRDGAGLDEIGSGVRHDRLGGGGSRFATLGQGAIQRIATQGRYQDLRGSPQSRYF